MSEVNIPIANVKVEKTTLIVIVVIVAIVILIADAGPLVRGLIDAIGGAIKGIGTGIVNGVNDATGVTAQDQANDSFSQRIDKFWKGNTWVNWMTPDLYKSSPSAVSISSQTALNLYNNIRSAEGNSFLGMVLSHGDMSGIKDQFAAVVGNQFDISYVSSVCVAQEGRTFGQICESTANFYNDTVGSSGESNLQMLAEFLEWANNLPTY